MRRLKTACASNMLARVLHSPTYFGFLLYFIFIKIPNYPLANSIITKSLVENTKKPWNPGFKNITFKGILVILLCFKN
jgi:succinate dehydrogenase/fumarate reductase cytochrome b subunit